MQLLELRKEREMFLIGNILVFFKSSRKRYLKARWDKNDEKE